jgi:hypothetical protein
MLCAFLDAVVQLVDRLHEQTVLLVDLGMAEGQTLIPLEEGHGSACFALRAGRLFQGNTQAM